jgi:hypothetical protein
MAQGVQKSGPEHEEDAQDRAIGYFVDDASMRAHRLGRKAKRKGPEVLFPRPLGGSSD